METIKQTAVIFAATAIIIFAGLWLAETEWADDLRNEPAGRVEEGDDESNESLAAEGGEDGQERSGIIGYIGSFIKEAIFIGVPGLITVAILRLVKGGSTRKKRGKGRKLQKAESFS